MPYRNYHRNFEEITEILHMLKFFHEIGIYAAPAQTPQQQAASKKTQQQKPVAVPPPSESAQTPPATTKLPLKQGEYEVVQYAIQANVKSGNNTHIQLRSHDGKTIQVLLKGENPAIASGVRIIDAKISEKVKEGIRFLILNDFQLAEHAAA